MTSRSGPEIFTSTHGSFGFSAGGAGLSSFVSLPGFFGFSFLSSAMAEWTESHPTKQPAIQSFTNDNVFIKGQNVEFVAQQRFTLLRACAVPSGLPWAIVPEFLA